MQARYVFRCEEKTEARAILNLNLSWNAACTSASTMQIIRFRFYCERDIGLRARSLENRKFNP